ncbi:small ubiquitin-related modifier 2-like [Ailuropoda melanoleuca]|uniref:small ubiquitin-related modifier 2-like n=1 Tax=Ailuropoda melanoleuca TaxID=9646 RepID=UPI001494E989|nr:small ubiquitin-related modifier 2-like [Ailuropoda melanoleuca]
MDEPKEGVKTENNDHVNLEVEEKDGSVVRFKIKRHMPLSKQMKAYCERQDTPAQLEVEEEDVVDEFQQQTGGVYQKGSLLLYCRTLFLQTKKTFSMRKLQFGSTTS